MEVVLAIVGVVVLYLLLRSRGDRQQERRELRNFCLPERGKGGLDGHWEGDFVTMTATFDGYDPDSLADPDDSPTPEFALVRVSAGKWKAERVGEHHGDLTDSLTLPPDVVAPLESQYQRFLLHYRER